jgi:protein phosphatase 1L
MMTSLNPSLSVKDCFVDDPASGGGLSENKKFSYGFSSLRGKRASMEDFYEAKISKIDDQKW